MSSSEFSEWMAYERVTGTIGPDREDIHAGIIASTMANTARSKKSKVYKPKDFIPEWDQREQTIEEQIATVRQIHQRVTRKKRPGKTPQNKTGEVGQDGNDRRATGQDRD